MNSLPREALRYAVAGVVNTVVGLLAIFAVMYVFRASPGAANAVGYAIGLCFSYGLNRVWTFSDRRPHASSFWRYILVVGISYLLNLTAVLLAIRLVALNPYWAQILGMSTYTICTFLGCRRFVFSADHDAHVNPAQAPVAEAASRSTCAPIHGLK